MPRNKTKTPDISVERRAYRVDEFRDAFRLSVPTIYKLFNQGKLDSILVGGRRLIPVEAVEKWLAASKA